MNIFFIMYRLFIKYDDYKHGCLMEKEIHIHLMSVVHSPINSVPTNSFFSMIDFLKSYK